MKTLLVFLMCSVLSFGADSAVTLAHKATHRLKVIDITEVSNITGEEGGTCSGTAVAANALLTAAHCVGINRTIEVDGEPAQVVEIMADGFDHAIYLLSGVTFTAWAELSKDADVHQGDSVFIFGNPGYETDIYRRGYVGGYENPKDKVKVTMYDLNGFFGDSGSGIFNDRGKIVGVISFVSNKSRKNIPNKYMESLPIELTEFQWQRAKSYSPPAPKEEKNKEEDFDGFFTRNNLTKDRK